MMKVIQARKLKQEERERKLAEKEGNNEGNKEENK